MKNAETNQTETTSWVLNNVCGLGECISNLHYYSEQVKFVFLLSQFNKYIVYNCIQFINFKTFLKYPYFISHKMCMHDIASD